MTHFIKERMHGFRILYLLPELRLYIKEKGIKNGIYFFMQAFLRYKKYFIVSKRVNGLINVTIGTQF